MLEVRTKDGQLRTVEIDESPVKDERGRVIAIAGALRDITDRKRAENELRESEERYRCIVENTHDVVMLTQPDGIVSYLSSACESVLGYAPADLVGTEPNIVHPGDQAKVAESLRKALRGLSGTQFEYRVHTKNGRTKWISHSWAPVLTNGRLHLVVSGP